MGTLEGEAGTGIGTPGFEAWYCLVEGLVLGQGARGKREESRPRS